MSEGCKHGHIANSCTACHEERRFRLRDARIDELTAERDAVKAELSTVMRERRDALQRTWNAEPEVKRLRAELERVTGGRMRDLLTDAEELCAKRDKQLRELREAAVGLAESARSVFNAYEKSSGADSYGVQFLEGDLLKCEAVLARLQPCAAYLSWSATIKNESKDVKL